MVLAPATLARDIDTHTRKGDTWDTLPPHDHSGLETLWRQRLTDARLRLQFAQNYFTEVNRDFAAGAISAPLERFALDQAIRAELAALEEYGRISAVFTDLMVHGTLPPDEQHKAAGEGE